MSKKDQLQYEIKQLADEVAVLKRKIIAPVAMLLWCPGCGERHIDEGHWATHYHHTHACQNCGMVWRPALAFTVGVRFLPGFSNLTATKPTDAGA